MKEMKNKTSGSAICKKIIYQNMLIIYCYMEKVNATVLIFDINTCS